MNLHDEVIKTGDVERRTGESRMTNGRVIRLVGSGQRLRHFWGRSVQRFRKQCRSSPEIGRCSAMSKAGVLLLVSLFASATIGIGSARSEERFVLDQRSASVEFAVTHFGLFTSHGFFRRFWAILQIDPAHPETVKIRFDIDARSIDIPWRNWIPELLSAAFFDVAEHPDLRFTSTVVSPNGPQHYLLRGFIQIRGVTRLITLKANLVDRKEDHSNGTGIADLIVTGKLKRSQFGMTADRISISDNVKLIIRARLQLNGRPG